MEPVDAPVIQAPLSEHTAESARPVSRIMRLIVPAPLLVGIVIGFAACCLAGYVCSRSNPYRNFTRFHINLSPDTYFYPTASQSINLARGKGEREKSRITVIVGGSSVMQGAGQKPNEIWTLHLQHLLGQRYRVLNLATRGGSATEGGAIAAEVLRREEYPVIYVTSLNPFGRPFMDGERHIYQFWDAWYKGYLPPDEARAVERAALARARTKPPKQQPRARATVAQDQLTGQETLLGARLDSWFFFNDLWTTVAYRGGFTVWTPRTADYPWTPRRDVIDPEGPQPPVERRFINMDPRSSLSMIRGQSEKILVKSPDGQWIANTQPKESAEPGEPKKPNDYQDFRRRIPLMFSDDLRPASIVVLLRNNPYFLHMLNEEERSQYAVACRFTVDYLKETGHASALLGDSYTDADYADWIHLVGPGGHKLAADVAKLVEQQAKQLGYNPKEARP